MVLSARSIEPVALSAASYQAPPANILETLEGDRLVGLLRQIGQLSDFAAQIFTSLLSEATTVTQRTSAIQQRLQRAEQSAKEVNETLLKSEPSRFYIQPVNAEPFVRPPVPHVASLTPDTQPAAIAVARSQCVAPPALGSLNRFLDGRRCEAGYSDPSFFFNQWLISEEQLMAKSAEANKAKREQRKLNKQKAGAATGNKQRVQQMQRKIYSAQGKEFEGTNAPQPTRSAPVAALAAATDNGDDSLDDDAPVSLANFRPVAPSMEDIPPPPPAPAASPAAFTPMPMPTFHDTELDSPIPPPPPVETALTPPPAPRVPSFGTTLPPPPPVAAAQQPLPAPAHQRTPSVSRPPPPPPQQTPVTPTPPPRVSMGPPPPPSMTSTPPPAPPAAPTVARTPPPPPPAAMSSYDAPAAPPMAPPMEVSGAPPAPAMTFNVDAPPAPAMGSFAPPAPPAPSAGRPAPASSAPAGAAGGDSRDSLLDAIRSGPNLRKTATAPPPTRAVAPSEPGSGLLGEIRSRNFQLRSVENRKAEDEKKPAPAAAPTGGLGSIMDVLARRTAIVGNDSDSDGDDDDWET